MKTAKLYNDSKNILGEGIIWSEENSCLYWVDIPMPSKLYNFNTLKNNLITYDMPEMITSISLRNKNNLLIASHYGLNNFNLSDKKFERILDVEKKLPQNRCNDGASDANGRYWFGTMQNNIGPGGSNIEIIENSGSIYCLDKNLNIKKKETDICISNTFVWNPDNTKFYFTDTITGIISSYDFDLDSGSIDNKKDFAKFDRGYPDGSTIDSEGYLWNCRWDGSCVVRFDPSGQVDEVVEVPVKNVTSCTFGGEDLKTLFITTARIGMDEDYLKNNPSTGGIFAINLDVRGQLNNKFAG
jgi:L-arabinonolactonase